MKVLFLDVDGVLNCAKSQEKTPSGFLFVEDVFLRRLKKILDETDAEVVLSSTWRSGYYDLQRGNVATVDAQDYVLLKRKLSEYGISFFHTHLNLKYIIGGWRFVSGCLKQRRKTKIL